MRGDVEKKPFNSSNFHSIDQRNKRNGGSIEEEEDKGFQIEHGSSEISRSDKDLFAHLDLTRGAPSANDIVYDGLNPHCPD